MSISQVRAMMSEVAAAGIDPLDLAARSAVEVRLSDPRAGTREAALRVLAAMYAQDAAALSTAATAAADKSRLGVDIDSNNGQGGNGTCSVGEKSSYDENGNDTDFAGGVQDGGSQRRHGVAVAVAAVGLHDVEPAVRAAAVQAALAAGEAAKCGGDKAAAMAAAELLEAMVTCRQGMGDPAAFVRESATACLVIVYRECAKGPAWVCGRVREGRA